MAKNNWIIEKRKADTRVKYMIEDNISHFSSTICPASRNISLGEIESLYEALHYYKDNNIEHVILTEKFMGSYVSIYLSERLEETRFFTRGGYNIPEHRIPRAKLLEAVRELHSKVISGTVIEAVVEGELMSWSALGKGLIDREFRNYLTLHQDHLNYLKNSSIHTKLTKILNTVPYQSYIKHGSDKSHINRQYKAVDTLINGLLPNLEVYEKSVDLYQKQLEKYAAETELKIEPFNLVYTVHNNGVKILNDDNSYFMKLNSTCCKVIYLGDMINAYKEAKDFQMQFKDLEGIMVKPLRSRITGIAHALKIRNVEYLQLIYGVNFDRNYNYYLHKRNIKRKLSTAIREYDLHCALSQSSSLDEKRSLYYKTIDAEKYEKELDNRL